MTVVDDAPLDTHPARNGTAFSTGPIATLPAQQPVLPPGDDDLVLADGEEVLAAPGSAKMLRVTRFAAVSITAVIGIASFILSFASLTDLAIRAGYPPRNLAPLCRSSSTGRSWHPPWQSSPWERTGGRSSERIGDSSGGSLPYRRWSASAPTHCMRPSSPVSNSRPG